MFSPPCVAVPQTQTSPLAELAYMQPPTQVLAISVGHTCIDCQLCLPGFCLSCSGFLSKPYIPFQPCSSPSREGRSSSSRISGQCDLGQETLLF